MSEQEMTETEDYDRTATPKPHATSHQAGGSDELDLSGLIFTSACKAYLSSMQSIPQFTATLVNLDAVSLDRNNDFDTTNHKFVCPVDGVYLILAVIQYATPPLDNWFKTEIKVNSTVILNELLHTAVNMSVSVPGYALRQLDAGDDITLYTAQSHAVDQPLMPGDAVTSMTILLLYQT